MLDISEFVRTTIELPRELLAKVKRIATTKGTIQNEIMKNLIVNGLKNNDNIEKIKARNISDKLPKAEGVTKEYGSLKDMAGIIELYHETNSLELKNSIHTDKKGLDNGICRNKLSSCFIP